MVHPRHFPLPVCAAALACVVMWGTALKPAWTAPVAGQPWGSGDLVRLVRKETIQFMGEPFLAGPKGQEFTVLKHEPAKGIVYLAFVQKEGDVVAVTLPEGALELVPPDGWAFLLRGTQAFRDQRFEDARRLLPKAAGDAQYKVLASAVFVRIESVIQTAGAALQSKGPGSLKAFVDAVGLGREMAAELAGRGYTSLAQALEEGLDRLGARVLPQGDPASATTPLPGSKQPREELAARAVKAAFSVVRCRQAMAVRRMMEANSYIEEGLKAEPSRPELKAMQVKVLEDIKDADDRGNAAESNRKRNLAQSLLALERGLKLCADHPRLLKLREEMSGALEERTAPPVTAEFVAAAKTALAPDKLEQGRQLYVVRCNQCHDLEMLDSRPASGWAKEVASMAGRAKINGAQQALIMDYITAALAAGEKVRK